MAPLAGERMRDDEMLHKCCTGTLTQIKYLIECSGRAFIRIRHFETTMTAMMQQQAKLAMGRRRTPTLQIAQVLLVHRQDVVMQHEVVGLQRA